MSSSGRKRQKRRNEGRWTRQEHERFLLGLEQVGECWGLVAKYVPTRTDTQIRSHAQKYFKKTRQGLPFPEEPYLSEEDCNADHIGAAAVTTSGAGFVGGGGGWRTRNGAGSGGSHGGSHSGGGASDAPPAVDLYQHAPCCVDYYPETYWLASDGQRGGEFPNQRHRQHELEPSRASGTTCGRFSPPNDEVAPFRNWPVAAMDLDFDLLLHNTPYADGPDHFGGDRSGATAIAPFAPRSTAAVPHAYRQRYGCFSVL